jgi:Sulfotransferase domain
MTSGQRETESMSVESEIVVVSGLPRSGTSLMMQMLAGGGIEIVTDAIRTADCDNPRGYLELERVKKIKHDSSWLPEARDKAFKMVSQLLYDLPLSERYRIIFMERDLDEVLASQEKMLERLGRTAAPREPMKAAYQSHLDRLDSWLTQQPNMRVLRISYNALVEEPVAQARHVCEFLERIMDLDAMVSAVDPALYRNRRADPAAK